MSCVKERRSTGSVARASAIEFAEMLARELLAARDLRLELRQRARQQLRLELVQAARAELLLYTVPLHTCTSM